MAFPFTINGHEYTKTGASTVYDFAGYGWVAALTNLIVDIVAVAVASDGLKATSTTSLAIGTGAKTFTIQAGKSFSAGTYVIATSAANSANYMHGQITSYTSGTGALITDIQDIGGSGTLADWNISLSGTRGAAGATFTGGTLTSAINEAPAVTIASGAGSPVAIGAAAANSITISGTTTVTAFDTIASGALRLLTFSGALTLTHHATSLILPGGVNITTVAGDTALMQSLGSGNWKCVYYSPLTVTGTGAGVRAAGAALTALTGLGIRSTGAAFDLTMATAEVLTGGRTITWTVNDAARSISLNGNLSYANSFTTAGNFAMTLTASATSNSTLPAGTTTLAALNLAQTFTTAQRGAVTELTDAATVAINMALANQFALTIGGNRTLGEPTNMVAGQMGSIDIRQDTTGSRTLAYAWPYVWPAGAAGTLSTPGCSLDQLVYEVSAYATSTVTITIAAPGVVSWTAHGLKTGQRIQLTTTGALPTGLTASTTYFWTAVDANSGKLSTTLANAAAGTYITTSGSQSGVHTMVAATVKLAINKAYA